MSVSSENRERVTKEAVIVAGACCAGMLLLAVGVLVAGGIQNRITPAPLAKMPATPPPRPVVAPPPAIEPRRKAREPEAYKPSRLPWRVAVVLGIVALLAVALLAVAAGVWSYRTFAPARPVVQQLETTPAPTPTPPPRITTLEAAQEAIIGTWTYTGDELIDDDGSRALGRFVFNPDHTAEYYVAPADGDDWGPPTKFRYTFLSDVYDNTGQPFFFAVDETMTYSRRRMEFIVITGEQLRFLWDTRDALGHGGTSWDVFLTRGDAFPFRKQR